MRPLSKKEGYLNSYDRGANQLIWYNKPNRYEQDRIRKIHHANLRGYYGCFDLTAFTQSCRLTRP